jgi:hypothetical protein
MDFPELGAAPKPAAPPPAAPARAVMGAASGHGATAGRSARADESSTLRPAPAARQARQLDNDWAEDEDGGMDFSKPIVINREDEAKGSSAASGAGASSEPLDPKEQAKMLAMKQQAKLAQMQEDMVTQARNQERQALESEQRQVQEREEERRRELDERTKNMEQRRREQEEADAKRRAEMEARRAEMETRREEEAKKREEEAKRKEEEAEKERQKQKELLATQTQLMAESREAARLRRQQEEEAAEAERKARAAEKLAELDRKRAEKLAAEEAERAKLEAAKPPPPPKQQPPERAGMGSMLRADDRRPAPRASPWNQHPTPDPDAERKQWEELRRDDRAMAQGSKPDSRPGYNQAPFGQFGNRAPNAGDGAPPQGGRGGQRGPRQPFENSSGRYIVDDVEPGQLRKQMAEREKLREKQAAKEAARKEQREQAEKEAAEGPSREELKRMALEERRKREAARRAREAEVAPEEIQNADPQRGSTFKGKGQARGRGQGSASQPAADSAKGEAAVDDLMAMPINNDFLTAQPNVWTGGIGSWGRSPEKGQGDEGERGKMQDANDVAARTADFLLDNDENSPEKLDGMASASAPNVVGMGGGGFGASWHNTVTGAAWGVGPSNGTWDGGAFAGPPFALSLGLVNSTLNSSLSLPSHPVWDSASSLPSSEFVGSQWAANVPRDWSAEPQSSLQQDAFQAGGGNAPTDKPAQAQGNNKQNGNTGNKGKQQREPKSARGGKGGGQKREHAQADGRAAGKAEDAAAASSTDATAAGAQQGAGRGAGKGGRGGHSDPSNPRQRQPRGGKGKAGASAEGEAVASSDGAKEGKGEKGEAPIKSRGPKPELFSKDIKQRAAALVKEKEREAASTKPAAAAEAAQ